MKKFFIACFVMCVITSPAWAASAFVGAQAVDEAWRKAMLANDLEAVMACYSKDAVMWLPDTPQAKGQEAIRKSYAGLFDGNTVTGASFSNTRYETAGSLSVGWGDFSLTLSPKSGGTPAVLSGRFSVIAKRTGNRWVYIVDHASSHPVGSPKH